MLFWALLAQGNPRSYWLGGLHVPDSLLTALIQQTSRSKGLALDKLVLSSEVTELISSADIAKHLEHGAYLEGMYIEVRQSCVLLNDYCGKLRVELRILSSVEHAIFVLTFSKVLEEAVVRAGSPMGLCV